MQPDLHIIFIIHIITTYSFMSVPLFVRLYSYIQQNIISLPLEPFKHIPVVFGSNCSQTSHPFLPHFRSRRHRQRIMCVPPSPSSMPSVFFIFSTTSGCFSSTVFISYRPLQLKSINFTLRSPPKRMFGSRKSPKAYPLVCSRVKTTSSCAPASGGRFSGCLSM